MNRNIATLTMQSTMVCLFLVAGLSGCSSSVLIKPQSDGIVSNLRIASPLDECIEWERQFQALVDGQKEELTKYGLVLNASGEKSGYYILRPKLVEDCIERIKIGGYFYRVTQGTVTNDDREYARQNSARVVAILRSVWQAPDLKERDLFFTEKELSDKDIASFLEELLKNSEYKSGLVYANIERPIGSLKSTLLFVLNRERRRKDIPRQIYALIALQKIDTEGHYLTALKSFTDDLRISRSARKGLRRIIRKFELNENVPYSDLEDLGLAIED